MGTSYYLVNHDTKALFDMGKSGWRLGVGLDGPIASGVHHPGLPPNFYSDLETTLAEMTVDWAPEHEAIRTRYLVELARRVREFIGTAQADCISLLSEYDADDLEDQGYVETGSRYSNSWGPAWVEASL